ncbi:MAG TPA: stage V sporulation protein AB [Tissierellaceae bacterium]
MIKYLVLVLIGLGGGVTVGNAVAAFFTILLIMPRLIQITDTRDKIKIYKYMLIISSVFSIIIYFFDLKLYLSKLITVPIGFILGIFVGLLSSALAEVLNVIPVLSRKLKIKNSLKYVVWALLGGKVAGSLFYWLLLK